MKNEAIEDGIKQAFDGIDANGKSFHPEFTGKYDGKDYPIKGEPTLDVMAYAKPVANTVSFVQKKGRKVVASGTVVISKDGKTSVVTEKHGNQTTITEFWEKQ